MASREDEARERVHWLISGLSDVEIAELTLDALRASRKERGPSEARYTMQHAVGRHLVTLLAGRKGWQIPQPQREDLEFVFTSVYVDDALRPVLAALWGLVHRGYLFPSLAPSRHGSNGDPVEFCATPAGLRLLDATDDHPALPRSLARAADRCANLAPEVVVHLEQAQACLDRGLSRPAVVLAGLAYEVAVDAIVHALVGRGRLLPAVIDQAAAKRLAALVQLVEIQKPKDEWYEVTASLGFAGSLRDRRNDASHPRPRHPFDDESEVEEILRSAARRLPGLWELHRRP